MPTYLIMGSFTDQGIKNVKETVNRGERFKEMAKECGVNIRELLWLMGDYDVFSIVDADSKESIMGLLLRASSKRFIKTTKFRAFHRGEIEGALKHVDYRDLELANESSG